MAPAYHMVHYRRFELLTSPSSKSTSLEALCREALNQQGKNAATLWDRPNDRFQSIEAPVGCQILLNKVVDLSSAVFGEMCLVQEKGLQAFLEMKQSRVKLSNLTVAEVFGLAEREAPQGFQFIRGLAYWLIIGNHLFFLKLQALGSNHIDEYLGWLLRVQTTTLPASQGFKLQAEFDRSQINGGVGEVKSLRLAGKSASSLMVAPKADDTVRSVATERLVAARQFITDQARPIAVAVLGEIKTESLIASLGPTEYLTADANLSVRGRRTENSKQKLIEIAGELSSLF